MKRGLICLASALIAVLSGCDDAGVFDENRVIEGGVWRSSNSLEFEFDVQDTVKLHDFFINVRNSEDYAYSNLFLFVEMEFPNGKKAVDTLDCPLADELGHWYGSGLGNIYDQRILYRSRVQFPLSGHYRVHIQQAMREPELRGIRDVGFRIAKAN